MLYNIPQNPILIIKALTLYMFLPWLADRCLDVRRDTVDDINHALPIIRNIP